MRNKHLWTSLVVGLVIAGGALAGNVSLPNVFQAGSPARASEVNANFASVKTAVDDNFALIGGLATRTGATESGLTSLTTRVGTAEGQLTAVSARVTTLEQAQQANTNTYTAPTLLNGWQNIGGQWNTVAFKKDSSGFVHLRGLVRQPSAGNGLIFTLPADHRPLQTNQLVARCGNDVLCYILIGADGSVSFGGGGAGASVTGSLTLDGLQFDTR